MFLWNQKWQFKLLNESEPRKSKEEMAAFRPESRQPQSLVSGPLALHWAEVDTGTVGAGGRPGAWRLSRARRALGGRIAASVVVWILPNTLAISSRLPPRSHGSGAKNLFGWSCTAGFTDMVGGATDSALPRSVTLVWRVLVVQPLLEVMSTAAILGNFTSYLRQCSKIQYLLKHLYFSVLDAASTQQF